MHSGVDFLTIWLRQAAEAEVAALQQEGLVDVSVPVGGSAGPALRHAFYCLLEQVSLQYPQAIPMSQVWGYGRPSWDLASRQYGQKPFRSACLDMMAESESQLFDSRVCSLTETCMVQLCSY